MSIEYTIDLQLTELGFPDILLPDKSCDRLSPEPTQQSDDLKCPVIPADEAPAPCPENSAGTPGPSEESDAGPGPDSDSESTDVSDGEYDGRAESSNHGSYPCSVCNLQFTSKSSLLEHMSQHNGSQFSCGKCGKTFGQVNSYRLHLRTHAKLKAKFFCRVCQIGYHAQRDLKAHLATTHLENKFYECDNCKKVFTSLQACQTHVEQRTCVVEMHCRICQQDFTSRTVYQRHRKSTCVFTHKCTVCQKTFSRKNALLRHSFTHMGCLPYTCMSCNTHFTKANLYHAHKCKSKPINCRVCLREFLNVADFKQHIHDTGCWGNLEPKEDGIRCLECGKRFDTVDGLKQHSSAHQKVLRCAECGKGFRSALLLMSHMGGHAGATPCFCKSCGLGFPHQQNFGSHLKTCGQEPKILSKSKKPQPSDDSKSSPVSVSPSLQKEAALKSDSSDSRWKLTLNKDPTTGTNLLLLLPVCMPVNNNQAAEPVAGDTAGPGAPLNNPTAKQDLKVPLDISNSSDIPMLPVKSEPEESEISGGPMISNVSSEAPAPASDIKEEPASPMDSDLS